MHWRKLGIVWRPPGNASWARTHAMIPTPLRISDDRLRIYVTCCDDEGVGRCGFVDVDPARPTRVLGYSEAPVLDVGQPGTFDDHGVAACSVVRTDAGRLFMYYVGFELGTRIRYRLLTGLAASDDGGTTFQRLRETPILERSPAELLFRCGPYVLVEHGRFRLWYIAGSEWTELDGKQMPVYSLRYLESADGIDWGAEGVSALDLDQPDEHGFGRPWVERTADGGYEMYYSIRRRSLKGYRLGFARSQDGLHWHRSDAEVGLDAGPEWFDRDAIMYSSLYRDGSNTYCFYNGSNFGRDGFAVAMQLDRR
jgi:hypothetical protein